MKSDPEHRLPQSARRGLPIALALVLVIGIAAGLFSFISIKTDATALLPEGNSEAARLMLQQIRTGAAGRLIMIGIEGEPAASLARLSEALTASLTKSGMFTFVRNGSGNFFDSPAARILFANRYLLSPTVEAKSFTVPALRSDLERLLHALQSAASPLVARFGFTDPTGAFLTLAERWAGTSRLRSVHGVLFAADRDRAVILAETRASGMDTARQRDVINTVHASFKAANPGVARLVLAGTAIFARNAARRLRTDIAAVTMASLALVALSLWWRFRSAVVLAAIAVPIVLSLGVAALIVRLVFGSLEGAAFGFGMTMLGVSVDYPVLLIGHRKHGETVAGTLRRIGPAFRLAVLTALLGLTGMIFSGFPGLSQLGLFAFAGLAVAAVATRFLLAPLIRIADLAPVPAGDSARLLRIEGLRRWRGAGVAAAVTALLFLVVVGGPRWQNDLAALSPVSPRLLADDASLRSEIGAPDPGQIGLVSGDSVQTVLNREERILPVLDRLRARHLISGAELAVKYLPSRRAQLARRAALPKPQVLRARIAEAARGLPFRKHAFAPFIADVAAARASAPVTLPDFSAKLLKARIAPLLFSEQGRWYGLIVPAGASDPGRLGAALRANGAAYIDVGATMNHILAAYTASAWLWLGASAAAALLALAIGLGDFPRLLRVSCSIAASLAVTLALLTAFGTRISLINLVSLQFVAGVGLDYALFFSRPQLDVEERARTLRTLLTCNSITLLTFGLLSLCRTPLLHQIGITVALGAFLALVFAFLFAGPWPRRVAECS
ncbi:MAG: MMPL family transporter [Acetobacteraceae bacterium]